MFSSERVELYYLNPSNRSLFNKTDDKVKYMIIVTPQTFVVESNLAVFGTYLHTLGELLVNTKPGHHIHKLFLVMDNHPSHVYGCAEYNSDQNCIHPILQRYIDVWQEMSSQEPVFIDDSVLNLSKYPSSPLDELKFLVDPVESSDVYVYVGPCINNSCGTRLLSNTLALMKSWKDESIYMIAGPPLMTLHGHEKIKFLFLKDLAEIMDYSNVDEKFSIDAIIHSKLPKIPYSYYRGDASIYPNFPSYTGVYGNYNVVKNPVYGVDEPSTVTLKFPNMGPNPRVEWMDVEGNVLKDRIMSTFLEQGETFIQALYRIVPELMNVDADTLDLISVKYRGYDPRYLSSMSSWVETHVFTLPKQLFGSDGEWIKEPHHVDGLLKLSAGSSGGTAVITTKIEPKTHRTGLSPAFNREKVTQEEAQKYILGDNAYYTDLYRYYHMFGKNLPDKDEYKNPYTDHPFSEHYRTTSVHLHYKVKVHTEFYKILALNKIAWKGDKEKEGKIYVPKKDRRRVLQHYN